MWILISFLHQKPSDLRDGIKFEKIVQWGFMIFPKNTNFTIFILNAGKQELLQKKGQGFLCNNGP